MIFKTIDADATNLTKKMGLLGKSFNDIKKDYSNGLGITKSLFSTSISESDWKSLQKFNSAIKVTNDGLTKSQRITKAWNENMTGCSIAAKRMGNDLVTGKKKISDVSSAMKTATASTKALEIAMNVFANVGFMLAITAVTKVISELAQAQSNAVETAKEATSAYNDELSSIKDYKEKISELNEELNSGNLSYEETKTKRSELMSIQDELIKKFGTEKSAIKSVTEAIGGQVDALDNLNEKSYRDWIAKADDETIWTKLLPWGKSGLDQAIDYMESKKTISFFDMANANSTTQDKYQAPITDEIRSIQEEIDKTIQSKYNLEKEFATFKITGTPEEVKSQLEAIRQDYLDLSKDAFLKNGISSEYWDAYRSEAIDSINDVINQFDEGLEKHQETYKTYIEGMIKYDSEYSDEYATILRKRAELEEAENSGDAEKIQKAKQEFMDAIASGITASESDENIKKYFESLYPELQAEFANWKFEIAINANTDNLKDEAEEIGKQYSATDLLDMVNTEGVQEGEEAFNKLIDKAIEYGVCTDNSSEEVQKLIDLLVELGIVQGNINSDVQHETQTSFEIPDADTLKQQISDLNSAIDSIQSAYDTLNSAVEEYNSNGGQLSIDTIQSLLSLSDEYLACLQVENGQLSLNADAMAQLAQAKLDEAQATAVTQAMTELQAIANGEAAQSTTNYITGNAALMDSLAQLSGSYEGVAQAAMTAAQAQELSAQISAASAKDKTATENVMKGLDTKLKLIQSTKNAISAGNFASVSKKSSSSGSSSKSSKDELKEQFQAEYDLLKHNLEMEYITEEDYYNGVQALNEKYFAGKEEYLDDYRKYEEEVYKGLKSYYKSYCDDMMDYYDKKLDASKMSYKEYCDSVSKMLADMHNSGKISDKDWYDYTKTMLEKQKDAYDRALSAITRRLQKEIDAWQAKIDALNDQNDALNDQKDNYDKILSAVSNVYDKEIDRLNEQKDLLQDQIDALNDKNDALDLQYRKEQALYALQKAQQQRTRKLYVEGKGYIYDTDNEAIRDAQKDLDDITNEELINSLQKEQDKIQESIDILEKYKEKWNEIPDAWDKAVSEQLAIELWGQEYEKLILMNRTSDIENFKTKYLKIQSQINDNEQLIKSYEEKVEYYTKLKEQWQSLTDEYSNSVDDMYAKMLLGQSWESDVLNGRLSTLNDFRNQYNDIQKSISDMAWQSANAQISALNAVKAAEATKAQTSGGSNGYSGSSGNVSSVSKPSQPQKDTVQHYWIYRTLGTFNTNGQASSKIGMLGGDGVISVGGKYLVVKWKKGYVTRGEASSNIVNYGGNGVYKRYASGTDNAKKGWNIVSEENPELIIRNNGEIDLAKGEQFYNFQGGEKVIPANETKEILKNQGNVEQLSDSDVITRKDGSILKPIHYEYENMLTNFIKDNPDYMYSMNTMSDNMCRDLFKNAENVNYDNRSVDNKVSIGEIHLHEVPNVDQFARELDRQLAGIVDQKLSRRKR
jgi:DNA repair exonuclease SbcCD ATPase subunit|nr:MAG TPA: putative membrane protein [Caudoviricetes sp.]